jgi:chromosome partitioning protein
MSNQTVILNPRALSGPIINALINEKGGIGKTTAAVNLSAVLALEPHKKRVLLLDLDPQGHASLAVGMRDDTKNAPMVCVLEGEPIREHIKESKFGFDILPGGRKLAMAALDASGAPIVNLKKALAELDGEYDVIFVDCPPQLGPLSLAALNVAHHAFVPMPLEFYPYDGLKRLLAQLEVTKHANPALRLGAIWCTHTDKRQGLAQEIERLIKESCGAEYCETSIRRNVRLAEAPAHEKPAFYYEPNAPGTQDFIKLASELESRGLV